MDPSPEYFPAAEDAFIVDDLLEFPNDNDSSSVIVFPDASTNSSSSPSAADCNSSVVVSSNSLTDVSGGQFSSDLCVPCDDLPELEWLSNFVEESFSSEDSHKLELIQGVKGRPGIPCQFQAHPEITTRPSPIQPEVSVPAKARSKRPRAAPGNWTSRLLVVSPSPSSSSSSDSPPEASTPMKRRKDGSGVAGGGDNNPDGRRCLHCATDKTPQWRTGPNGPKTLCNACGVRYKSGRLVPEYRPAASPTFVLSKHSNSHRKVLELRRQKDLQRAQQQQHQFILQQNQNQHAAMFDDDYLIHHHVGPDFRQLI